MNLISKCIKNIFEYGVVYIKKKKKFIIIIKNKLILKIYLLFLRYIFNKWGLYILGDGIIFKKYLQIL